MTGAASQFALILMQALKNYTGAGRQGKEWSFGFFVFRI